MFRIDMRVYGDNISVLARFDRLPSLSYWITNNPKRSLVAHLTEAIYVVIPGPIVVILLDEKNRIKSSSRCV